jgi:lysyl endopeptidase
MKTRILLVVALLAVGISSFAQTTDLGQPVSYNGKVQITKNIHTMPAVDVAAELAADEQRMAEGDKLMRFAVEHTVSVNILESADVQQLPNGDRLYQYAIHCPQALSVNIIFDQFELAQGTTLYLAARDQSSFAGAYTSANNNTNAALGTELVYSEDVFIEVHEPAANAGKSKLHLSKVFHGYADLDALVAKILGSSGGCNYDVNCPIGAGWENQRNSVVILINGNSFCTGSLVNNTSGAIIPYLLTANHCYNANVTAWGFRFRWERAAANTICGTPNSNANNGPTTMNVNGCTVRARFASSDFLLVELNTAPDPAWGIYYNGWDHSGTAATSAVGIHHPNGDIKKISFANTPLTSGTFNNAPPNSHWHAIWNTGVTEQGSSGSPLFDQNHRTVGQLHGGNSGCGGTDLSDEYGKFSLSWTGGGTNDSRLSNWLDPQQNGNNTIDGIDPAGPTAVTDAGISVPTGVTGTICGPVSTPQLTLTNTGSATLVSAVITYSYDGVDPQVYNWSGSLIQYQTAVITLPEHTFTNGSHTFEAVVSQPNASTDENASNNTLSTTFTVIVNGETITLNLNIDRFGSETSWQLLNANNTVLYSAGPYTNVSIYETRLVTASFCLSEACYTFKLLDSYGDGMMTTQGDTGSYTITNANSVVLAQLLPIDADYTFSHTENFCTGSAGISDLGLDQQITIYPNPAENILQIRSGGNVQLQEIQLISLTGQQLFSAVVHGLSGSMDLQGISGGAYLVRIVTSQGVVVKPLHVK